MCMMAVCWLKLETKVWRRIITRRVVFARMRTVYPRCWIAFRCLIKIFFDNCKYTTEYSKFRNCKSRFQAAKLNIPSISIGVLSTYLHDVSLFYIFQLFINFIIFRFFIYTFVLIIIFILFLIILFFSSDEILFIYLKKNNRYQYCASLLFV